MLHTDIPYLLTTNTSSHSYHYTQRMSERQLGNIYYLASLTSSFVSFFGWTLCLDPCGKCSALRVRRIRRAQYCLLQKQPLFSIKTKTALCDYKLVINQLQQLEIQTRSCIFSHVRWTQVNHLKNQKCAKNFRLAYDSIPQNWMY